MLTDTNMVKTAPTASPSAHDAAGLAHAISEAAAGLAEGGVPIGAALVSGDGTVIGTGRNRRVQKDSAILHGETDCLENIGVCSACTAAGVISGASVEPNLY